MDTKNLLKEMLQNESLWTDENAEWFFKEVILKLSISNDKYYEPCEKVVFPLLKPFVCKHEKNRILISKEAVDFLCKTLIYYVLGYIPEDRHMNKMVEDVVDRISRIIGKIPANSAEIQRLFKIYDEIKEASDFYSFISFRNVFVNKFENCMFYRNGIFIEIREEGKDVALYISNKRFLDGIRQSFVRDNLLYIESIKEKGQKKYFLIDLRTISVSKSNEKTFYENENAAYNRKSHWELFVSCLLSNEYYKCKSEMTIQKSPYDYLYNMGYFSELNYIKLTNNLFPVVTFSEFRNKFEEFYNFESKHYGNCPINIHEYKTAKELLLKISLNSPEEDLTDKIAFINELADKMHLIKNGLPLSIAIGLIYYAIDLDEDDFGGAFEIEEYRREIKAFSKVDTGLYELLMELDDY